MMQQSDSKVIGWFAYSSPVSVACTGSEHACVIAGSESAMRRYLSELDVEGRHTVRKTRFGEIIKGMMLGGAYAFDEESYGRFLPLGRDAGLPLAEADFKRSGQRFFTVQVAPS
jgi:hypothetical protein